MNKKAAAYLFGLWGLLGCAQKAVQVSEIQQLRQVAAVHAQVLADLKPYIEQNLAQLKSAIFAFEYMEGTANFIYGILENLLLKEMGDKIFDPSGETLIYKGNTLYALQKEDVCKLGVLKEKQSLCHAFLEDHHFWVSLTGDNKKQILAFYQGDEEHMTPLAELRLDGISGHVSLQLKNIQRLLEEMLGKMAMDEMVKLNFEGNLDLKLLTSEHEKCQSFLACMGMKYTGKLSIDADALQNRFVLGEDSNSVFSLSMGAFEDGGLFEFQLPSIDMNITVYGGLSYQSGPQRASVRLTQVPEDRQVEWEWKIPEALNIKASYKDEKWELTADPMHCIFQSSSERMATCNTTKMKILSVSPKEEHIFVLSSQKGFLMRLGELFPDIMMTSTFESSQSCEMPYYFQLQEGDLLFETDGQKISVSAGQCLLDAI